jgi:hypothetical protein
MTHLRTTLCLVATLSLASPLSAQERTGPPPEIRALVEAFVGGVTGTPAGFEAMAKEQFAPEFLSKTPAAARRTLYDQLHAQFGSGKRGPVIRQGPDAPLEIEMVGPKGSLGVIVVDIVEGQAPKITAIRTSKPGAAGK